MKFTPREIAENQLVKIEELQQMTKNLERITGYLHKTRMFEGRIDAGNLHDLLVQRELSEWRDLFMWTLALTEDERDRIKAAAHERFLRDGMSVSSWMCPSGMAGSWLAADEEEFRKMAKKAFAPKNGGTNE